MKKLLVGLGLIALTGCAVNQTIRQDTSVSRRLKGKVLSASYSRYGIISKKVIPARTTMILIIKLDDGRKLTVKKVYASHRRIFRSGNWIEIVTNSQKRISWIAGNNGVIFGPILVLKFTKKSRS